MLSSGRRRFIFSLITIVIFVSVISSYYAYPALNLKKPVPASVPILVINGTASYNWTSSGFNTIPMRSGPNTVSENTTSNATVMETNGNLSTLDFSLQSLEYTAVGSNGKPDGIAIFDNYIFLNGNLSSSLHPSNITMITHSVLPNGSSVFSGPSVVSGNRTNVSPILSVGSPITISLQNLSHRNGSRFHFSFNLDATIQWNNITWNSTYKLEFQFILNGLSKPVMTQIVFNIRQV